MVNPTEVKRKPRRKIICRKQTINDICYRVLDLPVYHGKPLWCGLNVNEPVLVKSVYHPPKSIEAYPTDDWLLSLCEVLLGNVLKSMRIGLAVYDKSGSYAKRISVLCKAAASVSVFTETPCVYADIRQSVYLETGCYIAINTRDMRRHICFCPYGRCCGILNEQAAVTPDIISEEDIIIPQHYAEIDADISRCALAEVLCMRCGFKLPSAYLNIERFVCVKMI